MRKDPIYLLYGTSLCLILAYGCRIEKDTFIPSFHLEAEKTRGLTTDVLNIKIKEKVPIPSNEKIYSRWDWDGDSIYNTLFSDEMEVTHRFYKPGNYCVRCEVLSLGGGKWADTLQFVIEQGFSAPKPKFVIEPYTGHFLTKFLLNACETIDDEDSLGTLKFRWDFENDDLWDTPFQKEPSIYHEYNQQGTFTVNLEVKDPSNRTAFTSLNLTLHNTDTCIVPNFNWSSQTGRVGDEFTFDASSSYHQIHPQNHFTYKWKFSDDPYTEGSEEAQILRRFISPGEKKVILLIQDSCGLQNTVEKELFVLDENLPPQPKIVTPIQYGNIETIFYLNAWETIDDHTPATKILLRWDFDGDGNWDTSKSEEKEFYHQYSEAGTYRCVLEAEDEEGLTEKTSIVFVVNSFHYQTGWIKDLRDGKYYGTVKIGDQWWMAENLDYRINNKMDLPLVQRCYEDDHKNCDQYGSLYAILPTTEMLNRGGSLCPAGWHIPSKAEMNTLIENIDFPNGMKNLRPSGSSGFNALFSGCIWYEFKYDPTTHIVVDTIYTHKDINFSTLFLTSEHRPNHVPPFVYTLEIQNNYDELYPMQAAMQGFYSVRCMKD